tara:strand:+ start:1206 stop:1721 length:516 start_codon:yes stop_codon:yes gene_type:complete
MNKEPRNLIIDKVAQYLHWLTIPKSEFGNMPVCPFLDKEMRDDNLYIDIWYPHDNSFMDIMESFLLSNKNSALVVCPNTHTIDYSEVSRKDIQRQITDLLRKNPHTEYLKCMIFSPYEDFEVAGVKTRSGAPYFLINVAPTKQLGKSHKDLIKTKYFQNFTDKEKNKLNVE